MLQNSTYPKSDIFRYFSAAHYEVPGENRVEQVFVTLTNHLYQNRTNNYNKLHVSNLQGQTLHPGCTWEGNENGIVSILSSLSLCLILYHLTIFLGEISSDV